MAEQAMTPADLRIRHEEPRDAAAIRALTEAAFRGKPYSSGTEARIVDALRAADALAISVVAVLDEAIVGHAAFSPVTINGQMDHWFGLGPVSVSPDQQRRGVGQALIRDGLDRLRGLNAKGCVVVGDPGYYRRFGFENDADLRYGDIPQMYVQRLAFVEPPPQGEVAFHPGFDVT